MIFWSSNLPLWFMNNLLWYYYFSWHFIRYIRNISTVAELGVLLIFLLAARLITATAVLVALMYIYPQTYTDYGFIIHCWSLVQIYVPFMGATVSEIAARLGPLKLSKNQLWFITDYICLGALSVAFFIAPFSKNTKVNFMFANLCDYGDLLICPILICSLYVLSHDFSTLSYIYSLYPRFWNDAARTSFPAFLFHWPIMLSLVTVSKGVLQFDNALDVIYISCVSVLFALLVDSYVVLALEDSFIDLIKPKLEWVMHKISNDEGIDNGSPVSKTMNKIQA
jgi:hypothetical protein